MAALGMRPRIAALALATALAGTGCELFKPAEPELSVGRVIIGNYSDPDSTLNTLAYGVRAKATNGGQDAYLKGLADPNLDGGRTFVAEFDPATIARNSGQTIPNPWGRTEESTFYSRLASDAGLSRQDLQWKPGDRDDPPIAGDSATVFRQYVVSRRSSSTNAVTTIGIGQAELRFVHVPRGWVIVRWIDREEPSPPANAVSYGQLRLNSR